ncbi:hypothetical protein GWI33_022952 [Rhynchophorus ferrugineus]|uniref:Uncharacterized protein n=1 Tax=Rhynchophorus ferrugineus TaxID=354439 RepID=A0A834HP02_RHYFE|nr:hypothetical protein GWI33_022957 [Rhynchophorus ferrugineus]KAF7264619.1 hypothetical protein GWI33_022952 [Rhynchophorus ferrugineus]
MRPATSSGHVSSFTSIEDAHVVPHTMRLVVSHLRTVRVNRWFTSAPFDCLFRPKTVGRPQVGPHKGGPTGRDALFHGRKRWQRQRAPNGTDSRGSDSGVV